jgi:hypothetical protein
MQHMKKVLLPLQSMHVSHWTDVSYDDPEAGTGGEKEGRMKFC